MVRWLLQEGADINATTRAGETALQLATYKHYAKAIKELKHHVPAMDGNTFVGEQSAVSLDNDHEQSSQYYTIPENFGFDTQVSKTKVTSYPLPPTDPTEFSEADGEESFISQDDTLVTGTTNPTWMSHSLNGSMLPSVSSVNGSPRSTMDRFEAESDGSVIKLAYIEETVEEQPAPWNGAARSSSPAAVASDKSKKKTSRKAQNTVTTRASNKDKRKGRSNQQPGLKVPPDSAREMSVVMG